ncbi:hypothetical protein HQ32_04964 [Prauserella sp. Am3]|nr:hypothetical protein HQ32_04964 [Prauserella sp. Am3]
MAGGVRAAEHLRQVFPEVHATTIRNTLSFHNCYDLFDDEGQPTDPETATAAKGMTDQLLWWARALRTARVQDSYDF